MTKEQVKANITITGSSTLSEEEKQKAIDEAERQRDADLAKKAKIDARNNADAVVFQTDKLVRDMGDKLASEDKDEVNKLKVELEELIKNEESSKEDLEAKSKELQDKLMKIGEKIYSSAEANAATEQPAPEAEAPKSDNVDVDSTPKSE